MISIYQYIASNDPAGAAALINKYGYTIQGVEYDDQLGEVLQQLVANEGIQVVQDLARLHPDKDLILETVSSNHGIAAADGHAGDCGCKKKAADAYVNKAQDAGSWFAQNQGAVLIVAALGIIAIALSKKS